MRGSDYAELRAFVAVADHGVFVRAAAHLGVSPSALSQTIRLLEERLGARLLNRTTRSVAPTEAGERLLNRIRPLLVDLDAATAEVSATQASPSGRLRINSTRIAANQYLRPVLGTFLDAYPGVSLEIVIEDRLIDIVAEGFDAGIRLGERLQKDMIAIPLGGDIRMRVVGAPAYLAAHGAPMTPKDLRHHACVNYLQPTDQTPYRWEFEKDDRRLEASVEGQLVVSDPELAVTAVVDGLGLGYFFEGLVDPLIADGRLNSVLEDWTPPFAGFHIYYPSRRQMAPALRGWLDFMRDQAGRWPGSPETEDGTLAAGS